MPVANCYCKKRILAVEDLEGMVKEWAYVAGVEAEDICINIINDFYQLGKNYSVLINLYLPSLWNKNDVKKIEFGLMKIAAKYLKVKEEELFIITSLIQSEHVVENGKIVKW